jgi:hypothetical protein
MAKSFSSGRRGAAHRVGRSAVRSAASATFEMLESRTLMSGGEPGDPILPDTYEPNNSLAAATNLGMTNDASLLGLTIHKPSVGSDVDYFKFTAAASGTVGAGIWFDHTAGDLQFAAYDGSGTLIKSSNTSTGANGTEAVSFNVIVGQPYYLKVSGVTTLTTSPDYSLDLQPLSVAYSWSMPSRFGVQRDLWGLPVIANTRDYARPNPVILNGVEVPTFGVRLDASATFLGSNSTSYSWHIVGPSWDQTLSGGPILTANLPEAQYTVTLTATAGATVMSTSQTVKVVDHLIVAIGDSYGSGEGNPHQGQQYDFFGFTTSGAKWAQGTDDAGTAANRRAHRSSYAGVVQAALNLENSDPNSSVTLVFLDHTGAMIDRDLLGLNGQRQASGDAGEPGDDAAQLDQMDAIVGNRRIDAMVVSVGGNDAGLLDIGKDLIAADPDKDGSSYQTKLDAAWAKAATGLSDLPYHYSQLEARLQQYNIGQVFLTEYPDPTHDSTGGTALKIADDIVQDYEIDQNELNLVRQNLLIPMAQKMARAAVGYRWTYVSDIASAFATHGYGNWFRTASDSVILQGPLGNRNIITDEKTKTTGTLHPTAEGQNVYRDRLTSVFNQPDLVTTGFTLTSSAFLRGATDGYTITVRNRSLTAGAGASVARIYISPDAEVNRSDFGAQDINIPALGPGESVTVSGVLNVANDPYRTWGNFDYVAPVLDVNNQVAESDELDNVSVGFTDPTTRTMDLATVTSDRDLQFAGFSFNVVSPQFQIGQTVNASLGLDEFAGGYDVDFYTFDVTAGQRLAFDVDNAASSPNLDTYIRVYPMFSGSLNTGALLAANDNGRAPGEPTANNGESFLRYTFPNAGKYCVVVSHAANGAVDPLDVVSRVAAAQGDYAISITSIDNVAPAVSASSFDYNTPRQRVRFTFSEDLLASSLSSSSVELTNLTSGQVIPPSAVSYTYDAATKSVSFTYTGQTNGALPDGNYHARLLAGGVQDTSGNPLSADYGFDFFTMSGDANHDRKVDLTDFTTLAANFNGQNRTFSQADFSYDGKVDLTDFTILAANFNKTLPAQSPPSASIAAAPRPSAAPRVTAEAPLADRDLFFTPTAKQDGDANLL